MTIPIRKGRRTLRWYSATFGYDPQEVAVGNRTKIDIALKSSSVDIDEVVVTGYQNLKKQTFTGSSVKLNASDLNVAGTSDISRMLEGKAAGVSVQNVSGTFVLRPRCVFAASRRSPATTSRCGSSTAWCWRIW